MAASSSNLEDKHPADSSKLNLLEDKHPADSSKLNLLGGLTIDEGVNLLYQADIISKLYQRTSATQMPLQLRILLSIPEVTAKLEQELRLPITGNWHSLITNYIETFYTENCEEISTPYHCLLKAVASGMTDWVINYIDTVGIDVEVTLERASKIAGRHGQFEILQYLVHTYEKVIDEDDPPVVYPAAITYALIGDQMELGKRLIQLYQHQLDQEVVGLDYEYWFDLAKECDFYKFNNIIAQLSHLMRTSIVPVNPTAVLNGAANGGQLELLRSVINSGCLPGEETLQYAVRSKNSEVINEVLKYIPRNRNQKLAFGMTTGNDILYEVAQEGDPAQIESWLNQIPNPNIKAILDGAAAGDQVEIVRHFLSPEMQTESTIRYLMQTAGANGSIKVIQYLISLNSNMRILNAGLVAAAGWDPDNKHRRRELIKFFLQAGATDLEGAREALLYPVGTGPDTELVMYIDQLISNSENVVF